LRLEVAVGIVGVGVRAVEQESVARADGRRAAEVDIRGVSIGVVGVGERIGEIGALARGLRGGEQLPVVVVTPFLSSTISRQGQIVFYGTSGEPGCLPAE